MDGDKLIDRVRTILGDVETSYKKGTFWSEVEILQSLNLSQDIFINACIRLKQYYFLNGLITSADFFTAAGENDLPADYLHYISAVAGAVKDFSLLRMARVYLGGIGYTYMYVNHDAVIILGDSIYFKQGGDDSKGILFYFCRPTDIVAETFDSVFPDYVYYDILANHASIMLGMKETQTSREFKKTRRQIQQIVLYPKRIDNYITDVKKNDFEPTVEFPNVQQPKNQQ
jgi:hypothetical protein